MRRHLNEQIADYPHPSLIAERAQKSSAHLPNQLQRLSTNGSAINFIDLVKVDDVDSKSYGSVLEVCLKLQIVYFSCSLKLRHAKRIRQKPN